MKFRSSEKGYTSYIGGYKHKLINIKKSQINKATKKSANMVVAILISFTLTLCSFKNFT